MDPQERISTISAGFVLAGVVLIELHGPHGQRLYVNPAEVTSVRELRSESSRNFAYGTHCALIMTNGNTIQIRETCAEVRKKLEGVGAGNG